VQSGNELLEKLTESGHNSPSLAESIHHARMLCGILGHEIQLYHAPIAQMAGLAREESTIGTQCRLFAVQLVIKRQF
jgi:hypothetical protein